ncbi:MAG: ATPase/DNA packaging protein, partial [Bacteroidota bacterium]
GAGKTNWLLNLIKLQASNCERIVVCTKNASEPLYQFLQMKIPPDQLKIYEGNVENIPHVDTFKDSNESILMVFDDLMLEKDQKIIEEYYIRGRKVAGGISCCYLSQSFVKVPITIRRNIGYFILKKVGSMKDITTIIKNYSLECSKEAKQTDFLMVDLSAPENERFRHNFKNIIKPAC